MGNNTQKKDLSRNDGNTMLADALPPMNVIVEALFRYSKDWSKITGEKSVREEIRLTRRIPVKDNSRGWVWSHHEIKTASNGEVVWWRFR